MEAIGTTDRLAAQMFQGAKGRCSTNPTADWREISLAVGPDTEADQRFKNEPSA